MVISHNMLAMNANRMLNLNTTAKSKSTEKLSSGYKVNRAADDAAGLAISEKMRNLIRGLNQGSNNIQEGVSLIQIADGAMDEMCSMLHRIKELSVKAYNDTNTAKDREIMQQEISQIISELDRVSESADYNTIKVLKGNPVHSWTEQITEDKLVERELIIKDEKIGAPSWLKIDAKVNNPHSYSGIQDVSSIMLKGDEIDGKIVGVYYGPDQGTLDLGSTGIYSWSGKEWTPTISDNAVAKIDFSNLSNVNSAEELYGDLFGLLGTAIGFPCGTCNTTRLTVGFSGAIDGFQYNPTGLYAGSGDTSLRNRVDLTSIKSFTDSEGNKVNCFDAVKNLVSVHSEDTTKTDSEKLAEVRALGNQIAKQLASETNKKLSTSSHYDRTLYNTGDTSILVYDYRDIDLIEEDDTTSNVITTSTSYEKIPYFALEKGQTAYFEEYKPISIVCSNVKDDCIDFELPCLTAGTLGLNDYNVADYTYDYTDEFKKRMENWKKDYTDVSHTIDVTTTSGSVERKFLGFKNGEPQYDVKYISSKNTTQQTVTERIYNSPKPEPTEKDIVSTGYNKFDSNRVDYALDIVLSERARLGAIQNRLEHSFNNNNNKSENTTAAESQIRDTDMATEMVKFSNHNVLEQAGQSILAQANQFNQAVLALL